MNFMKLIKTYLSYFMCMCVLLSNLHILNLSHMSFISFMDVTDFLRIIALPLLRILPKFPPDSVNLVQSFLLRVPQMLGGPLMMVTAK